MFKVRVFAFVVLVLYVLAPQAFAQSQLLSPASRATQIKGSCRVFIETKPGSGLAASAAPIIRVCLVSASSAYGVIKLALDEAGETPPSTIELPTSNNEGEAVPTDQSIARLNPYLVREHLNLKALDLWVRGLKKSFASDPNVSALAAVAERVRAELDELLARRGLRELFSAAMVSGAVIGNGQPVSDTSGGEQSTNALAHIVWESKHFGDDRFEHWDFAFGGKFGFTPALSLVEPADPAPEEDSGAEAVYQEAFVWDVGARANFRLSGQRAAEVSLGGRVGQTVLGTQSVLLDRGPDSILAVPINGSNTAELFYEIGVQYNLFNNPLEVVHGEGSMVSPTFQAGIALRLDNRFKRDGELAAFDSPARRIVFRFMIDALKVVDRRQLAEKPRIFTFGFGVEHEAAVGGGDPAVPSGTKLVFRGDIDLLRALRGR